MTHHQQVPHPDGRSPLPRRPRPGPLHWTADLVIAVALVALDAFVLVLIGGLVAFSETGSTHGAHPTGLWTPVVMGLAALAVTAAVSGLFACGLRRLHAPIAAALQVVVAAAVALAALTFGIAEYRQSAASQSGPPVTSRLLP
jgi:hypothetical protein